MGDILVSVNFLQVQMTNRATTTKAAKAPETKVETLQLSSGFIKNFEHSTFHDKNMKRYINLQPNPAFFRWHGQASDDYPLWFQRLWHWWQFPCRLALAVRVVNQVNTSFFLRIETWMLTIRYRTWSICRWSSLSRESVSWKVEQNGKLAGNFPQTRS